MLENVRRLLGPWIRFTVVLLLVRIRQVEGEARFVTSGHDFGTRDFQELPQQSICVDDDALEQNWDQLLADINAQIPGPKISSQVKVGESPVVPSEEQALTMNAPCSTSAVSNGFGSASTKTRMRWTQELHEKFVEVTMKLTEALRLQMELQKHLHENLENQRKLQLQIEEQGKCLEMMMEKQQKMQEVASAEPSRRSSLGGQQPQRVQRTEQETL